MSNGNSTRPTRPSKPRPDFPLFPHATGRWAKKIRGKLHYFGPWNDPDSAVRLYLDRRDALDAGLTPADTQDEMTVRQLVGRFLTAKQAQFDDGSLSAQLHEDYRQIGKRLVKSLGTSRTIKSLGPDDFTKIMKRLPATWGVYQRKHEVVRIKTIFRYAVEEGIIPHLPIYGTQFKPPTAKTIRKHRASRGPQTFTADEIRLLLDAASTPLKAMILLGINTAMGNHDLAQLPMSAIKDAWLTFARVKTGIPRRTPLWPETIAAINDWLKLRPAPAPGNESLVFVTVQGGLWAHAKGSALTAEFSKLLRKIGLGAGRGFYSLRRTFQNVGDEARDFLAVRSIMGHVANDVSDFYRERVSDGRIKAVTEHVRAWLFANART